MADSSDVFKMEFDYAKQTSLVSQDDRLKLVNFYLGLYATVLSLIFGLQNLSDKDFSSYTFMILLILGLISYIFNIQIVRLRQAWVDSVIAMNSIKQFYVEQDPKIKKYLKWSVDTIPAAYKFKTISFLSALVINILGSIAIGLALSIITSNIIVLVVSLSFFIVSEYTYYIMLKKGI